MPEQGEEKRGGAGTPLLCCWSLFVPLTLVAVTLVLVRGDGLVAVHTGALSFSTAQVPCKDLGVAGSEPRGCLMDYSRQSIPLILPLAGQQLLSLTLAHLHPLWLIAFVFLTPFLAWCFHPLLSPWEEHSWLGRGMNQALGKAEG